MKYLIELFDEYIFKNTDETIISVDSSELTEEQNENILNFFRNISIIYQLKYEIVNNPDCSNQKYSQRGYELD